MSLSQKYRLKFAANRGDRLMLCLAAAVVFHLGLITVGLALWQQVWTAEEVEQPEETVPIEFVYLDQPTRKPAETKRQAAIDAAAGGERKSDLPTNAGKPEVEQELIAATNSAKPSAVATPPTGMMVPTSNLKAATPPEPPQSVVKPSAPPVPPAPVSPAPAPLPSLEAADPALPTDVPVHAEMRETAPANRPSPSDTPANIQANLPATVPASESTVPVVEPSQPAPIGSGLDGSANPNRTALSDLSETGLDAARDPVLGAYLSQLNRAVYQDWRQIPNIDATRATKVKLTISQLGELVDIEVTQSSGSDAADQIAIAAVRNAAPFAPLPPSWGNEPLVVNVTLTHQLRRSP